MNEKSEDKWVMESSLDSALLLNLALNALFLCFSFFLFSFFFFSFFLFLSQKRKKKEKKEKCCLWNMHDAYDAPLSLSINFLFSESGPFHFAFGNIALHTYIMSFTIT